MASNWQETYKKLKKRKEAIDKTTNEKELNQAKQSYGRTGKSLYTGKAIGALNSNQTPSKKITTTKPKKKDNDRLFSAFDDGYDFGDISKTILKGGKKVGNFIGDEVVEPIKDSRKNYQLGKLSEDMGMEAYKKMMGEDNDYDRLKKKYDRFVAKNPDLINDANYLDQTIQTLPNQLGALKSGIQGGGIGATAGAILGGTVGAVGSALGTSGVGVGAGAVAGATTGAKWLGGTGYVTGSAEYTYKLEAGLQYQTLLEMGVPEDIAKEESKDTGAVNALIEGGESILDLYTLGGVSALKTALTKNMVKKHGSKTVASWVGENVVKNAVSEGIEEGLQETTSIHNEKQAMERAGLERDDSLDKERIKESVIAGGFAGGLIGGATGVVTGTTKAGLNTIQNKKNTQVEDIAPIQVQQEKTQDDTNLKQQNYQYIPKDTDSEQRRIISEDASKYANNTPRTHEFVDFLVNVNEATGINFRIANNEAELITSERAKYIERYARNKNISIEEATKVLENRVLDAYNNGDIVLNIDTPLALNRVVGHEVSHSLEQTKEYAKLQKIAIAYAKTKGEYKSRIERLEAMYDGSNADITKEFTAEAIGDYLFSDQEFINTIHAQDRNLFQRIYDEIKHLIKMATAGSKEARQLEQLKHSFEKAMRENKATSNTTIQSNLATVEAPIIEEVKEEQVTKRTTPSQEELDNLEDIRKNKSGSEYADAFYSLEKKYGKANLYKGLNSYKTTGKALEYSLSEAPTKDSKGRILTEGQRDYLKNEDKNLIDKNGNLKVLYHGTPFGDFTTFKGDMFFFSEDYKFAEDYADSKSFEQGLDGDRRVVEAYIKAENVFDVTNPEHIQKLREALSDEINFWGRKWDKETLLKKLQRKDTLPPKWKPEQIEGKQFGDYIGDDRNGYNTDMFVGVNEQNEIVYISQERGLQNLSQAEKDMFQKELMAGKEVSYVTYQTIYGDLSEQGIHEKISELQKQGEEYKRENGVEKEAYNYYIKELEQTLKWIEKDLATDIKHKLIPKTATQETTELTDIDNWTYFETAFDSETRKDIVDIVKDLGYDAINIYESGISNYIVFNPNQIKNVTNQNPTSDPDIRYSLSDNQEERILKLQNEIEALDKTRDVTYDERDALREELNKLIRSDDYKNASSKFMEMVKSGLSPDEISKTQEYQLMAEEEKIRKKLKEYDEDIKVLNEDMTRISEMIEKEEKSHRNPKTAIKQAKDFFGITNDFREAGYLLQDGTLLDFSGRSQGSRTYGRRALDHREINEVGYDMNEFIELGNIRMKPESSGFELSKPLTKEQKSVLRDYLETLDDDIMIDITKEGKVLYDSAVYKKGTTASKIFSDLDYYFENGKFPKQSEFAQFLYSLSRENTEIAPTSADIFGSEIKLQQQVQEAIAPLQETIQELNEKITTLQENIAPIQGYTDEDISLSNQRNIESLEAQNIAPIEDTSPDVTPTNEVVNDPFEDRDIKDLRKAKPYMYENPEVKPFFQQAARKMLGDLDNTIPGEKIWLQQLNPDTGMYEEGMVTGTKRLTTDDIAYLKDTYGYKYDQIRAGLNAIIEDNSKEVNKVISKRLEFMLNDRLMNGYKSVDGFPIPPSNEYRALIRDKNIQEYTEQAFAEWNKSINQDELAPTDIEYVSNSIPKAEKLPIENSLALSDINIPETQNEPRIEGNKLDFTMESMARQAGRQAAEEMRYTNKSSKVAKTKKQMFGDAYGKLREQFFNSFHYVDKFARDTGNQQIKYNTDMYNNVAAEIDGELTIAQTDNYGNPIGEALLQPFEEAKANGEYEQLNDYLMHYSNIDRHHVGKGSVVPLEYSRKMIVEYDKTNPNLNKYARRVWKGYKNDLANMQSNGLISGQFNMTLQKMYPHYNPFMFEQEFKPSMEEDGVVRPKKVIKRAEGGAFEILEMEEARVRYTQSVRSAIRKNDVLKEIVHASDKTVNIGEDGRIDPTDINQGMGVDVNGNFFATAYIDGQMQQTNISEDIYRELTQEGKQKMRALEDKYALITKPLQGAGKLRRNLLTTWSPTFMITNPVKDIQDASFSSKYTKDFAKHYPTALVELGRAKTPEAKQFLTLYGTGNTWGEYDTNNIKQKNSKFVKNVVNAVPNFNNLVELAPRFAEFKASLDNGANIQEAMYNAREVTVNFGRGGYVAKALNRNGFTFLNASLQGFDKLARNFSGENGAKGVVGALTKVAILGVAPSVFNALAFGTGDDEDEDYKALPDYIKDNYYLIKTDDGEFIRIPKGRMLSIFGSAARRTMELMQGEKDAFEGYLTNAYSQVGVQNPLESNIFAPLFQAFGSEEGKTWYGSDLVPTRLQGKPVEEQYDESTDEFSKWLGQHIGISPYKINYVLDQYSGGIGDLALPIITEEANSDGNFLAPIKDKFTANTTFDNKYVSDFYGTRDKMEVKANGSKATEEDLLRSKYLDSVSWEMSELYKEKREVQSNSDLTKAEKFEKVQRIQEQINSLAEEGLNSYENIHKTSSYAQVGDKEFYKDANDEWKEPYEDELEELNSLGMEIEDKSSYFEAKNDIYLINKEYQGKEDTYEDRKRDIIEVVRNSNLNTEHKSYLYGKYYSEDTTNIVNTLGIDFDAYLDYETQYFVADKDENGKSISGSKKEKVFDYINSMDIGFEEKAILAKLEYNSYDEWNHEIINYLNNSDITYDEMVFILKQMGFEVDNEGNIFWD